MRCSSWIPSLSVLLLGVLSGSAAAQQAGAPAAGAAQSEQSAAQSKQSAARSEQAAPLLYNDEDLRFLRHMIVHHEQAVVMSLMVPGKTGREAFIQFASYVKRAQAAEIDLMQSLLDLAAERGLGVPEHGPHGDPPMAGMLSSAQMEALAGASGAEFERLWMEGMIYHHQGAIDMAYAQQRRQLETRRRPYGLSVLVEDIIVEQRAEISRMREWLRDWGLASP